MTITERDRRLLIILPIAVAVIFTISWLLDRKNTPGPATTADSAPLLEQRLDRLRRTAATVPGKEDVLKQVKAELSDREKHLITADTAAQAQAQLLQRLTELAKKEGIDVRGNEDAKISPFGSDYGEASIATSFLCTIEQLVNLLSAIANEQQLIATKEIRVSAMNSREKIISVRLTASALVPKKLVPVTRKGDLTF